MRNVETSATDGDNPRLVSSETTQNGEMHSHNRGNEVTCSAGPTVATESPHDSPWSGFPRVGAKRRTKLRASVERMVLEMDLEERGQWRRCGPQRKRPEDSRAVLPLTDEMDLTADYQNS